MGMAPSAIGVSGFFAPAQAIPGTTVTVQRRLTDLHGLDHVLIHRSILSSSSIPCRLFLLDRSPFRLRSSPVSTMP